MSRQVERLLSDSSQRPARAPDADLHGRIMDSLEGDPGYMPAERGALPRVVAGALLAAGVIGLVTLIASQNGTRAPVETPAPAPVRADVRTIVPEATVQRLVGLEVTTPLEREAERLANDAKAVWEGLRARVPLM